MCERGSKGKRRKGKKKEGRMGKKKRVKGIDGRQAINLLVLVRLARDPSRDEDLPGEKHTQSNYVQLKRNHSLNYMEGLNFIFFYLTIFYFISYLFYLFYFFCGTLGKITLAISGKYNCTHSDMNCSHVNFCILKEHILR